jgi:hypothetical protein
MEKLGLGKVTPILPVCSMSLSLPLVPRPRGNYHSEFMKSAFLLLAVAVLSSTAQELQVVDRGPHHQVLNRITSFLDENGKTFQRTNRITELANSPVLFYPTAPMPNGNSREKNSKCSKMGSLRTKARCDLSSRPM